MQPFSDLFEFIKEAFPFAQIQKSFYTTIKMIKDMGLHYEKICACPNDYILFWNDTALFKSAHCVDLLYGRMYVLT